jgi:hypothetical protein
VVEIGRKWRIIQSFFPGRTDTNIKNHWRQMERQRGNKERGGSSKMEEDDDVVREFTQFAKKEDEEMRERSSDSEEEWVFQSGQ